MTTDEKNTRSSNTLKAIQKMVNTGAAIAIWPGFGNTILNASGTVVFMIETFLLI
ncbi:MAG: hypothetical protein M3044_11060 [Thermoproteota archaeon]|nr:hypothetical protein [Thermoproteota archaeon]